MVVCVDVTQHYRFDIILLLTIDSISRGLLHAMTVIIHPVVHHVSAVGYIVY